MTKLLYYYANWNSQCKAMTPILNELQEEFPTIKIIRINNEAVDKKITSAVPLIIIEEDEKEVLKLLGFKTKNSLSKIIKEYV